MFTFREPGGWEGKTSPGHLWQWISSVKAVLCQRGASAASPVEFIFPDDTEGMLSSQKQMGSF